MKYYEVYNLSIIIINCRLDKNQISKIIIDALKPKLKNNSNNNIFLHSLFIKNMIDLMKKFLK